MEHKRKRTIKNRQHIPDYVRPILEAEYQRGKIEGRKEGILFCKELMAKDLNVLDSFLQLTSESEIDHSNP